MSAVLRWLAAIAAGVAAFEGLDALAARTHAMAWLGLASPFIAGAIAAWAVGGSTAVQLLASAVVAWVRIGADEAVGFLHGAHHALGMDAAVAVVFGLPWTAMALGGGAIQVLARRAAQRYGNSPRVT